ncbi:PRC-barrel domain containing protein [Halorarius litoreus]|uniref:PRC-barrel domain containing protein n=1 Tax=Halorarius litoreus TaxID=2962676 RepID=UPI0020CEBE3E|nr:PRC-barrel domain containing protein [Halorarius litoreus]
MTADDEGKNVISTSGDQVGRVISVKHGQAHVDPEPGLVDTVSTTLGGDDQPNEDTYRLNDEQIDTITDDEIRLRS